MNTNGKSSTLPISTMESFRPSTITARDTDSVNSSTIKLKSTEVTTTQSTDIVYSTSSSTSEIVTDSVPVNVTQIQGTVTQDYFTKSINKQTGT